MNEECELDKIVKAWGGTAHRVQGNTTDEILANVQLIGAAPDLYRHGKALLASIDSGAMNDFAALHGLRVAIAKAEGRTL